jgi:glutamate-1-semialdehyde 2,1-aminomutase
MPWNHIDSLTRFFQASGREIAAVLMEPMMCNSGAILPQPGYLQAVRDLCDDFGAVLIFDEVITGFRLGPAGAQGLFGVTPDLSVFAKAIGGGFPLAMLAGRSDMMELIASGAVNHSGTYNSNVVSIAAGLAALRVLSDNDGRIFEHINRMGRSLMTGLQGLGRKRGMNLFVSGVGAVFNTSFTDQSSVVDYASFQRAQDAPLRAFLDRMLVHGVRPTSRGTWFVSAAHTDADIHHTLAAADEALGEI